MFRGDDVDGDGDGDGDVYVYHADQDDEGVAEFYDRHVNDKIDAKDDIVRIVGMLWRC